MPSFTSPRILRQSMKKTLRSKYKELRSNLSSETIEDKSIDIANKLLELPIWDFSFYHLFLTISDKKEIDTEPILHILQGKDKNVILSKSNFVLSHSSSNHDVLGYSRGTHQRASSTCQNYARW